MLLARVAENLYWMGRYLERAENLARLINVNSHLLLDLPKGIAPGWRPLIEITGNMALYSERQSEFDEVRVLRFLVTADDNPGSILASLYYARENARTIRDIIPREAWELINALHHYARENQASALSKRGRFDYLNQIILRNQTLTGCLVGTMNRDAGYTFVSLGQNIERADMTRRFIDGQSANLIDDEQPEEHPRNAIQWISVLKSLSGYQAYRRAMQVRVRRTAVLRFLLQHREFPRTVRHALAEVAASLRSLPNHDRPLALALRLEQGIENSDVERLSQQALHRLIDELQIGLGELSQAIAERYFLKPHPTVAEQSQDALDVE